MKAMNDISWISVSSELLIIVSVQRLRSSASTNNRDKRFQKLKASSEWGKTPCFIFLLSLKAFSILKVVISIIIFTVVYRPIPKRKKYCNRVLMAGEAEKMLTKVFKKKSFD